MSRGAILHAENVTKVYEAGGVPVTAINHVTVSLYPGKVLAIFGPSGSGKTTFLMMAGLIDAPTSGEVLFRGQTISNPKSKLSELSAFRRRHIGFVFQRANLIPFLTAIENVEIALQLNDVPHTSAKERALSLLNLLNVGRRANSFPQQLSGGEQQRVAIARALANRPSLLFADEPTGALDSVHGRQVLSLFREVADQEGVAVCVVTHDTRATEFFDDTVFMNDGAIVKGRI